ncbi:DUF726 domain-containing protein [Halomarina pelagica]|uniref:DUF726 domain-containing protein n=1 Tax=Halomarina pelagica TaxID=2961599 RepID=UPI0020C294A5|nr:DUF726 domain-containing protein [Halomarina sp. BND7]
MRETSTRSTRRQFVRRATAATAGALTLGALGSPAAAATYVPVVSTREHFDDSATLTSGHTATDYDTDGTVPGVDVGCVDDLLVFVHGWDKKSSESEAEAAAEEKFEHADARLDAEGYWGTVVGYSWDNDKGGGVDYGWAESKEIATKNGPKLANFLTDYASACGGTIRLACHSLGARVTFSALQTLDGWGYADLVESVHVLGGAVDNERPTLEHGDGYDAVANVTRATFNYYSGEDDVLEWVYNSFEFDQALGETGAESGNAVPGNYTDFDATGQVGDDHSGYLDALTDEMVYHMRYVSYYD